MEGSVFLNSLALLVYYRSESSASLRPPLRPVDLIYAWTHL